MRGLRGAASVVPTDRVRVTRKHNTPEHGSEKKDGSIQALKDIRGTEEILLEGTSLREA